MLQIKEFKYTPETGMVVIATGHFTEVAEVTREMASIAFGNQRWWFVLIDGAMPDSATQPSDMEWRVEAMLEENR